MLALTLALLCGNVYRGVCCWLGAAVVVVVGSRCEDKTRDEAAVEQVERWEEVGWEEGVEG